MRMTILDLEMNQPSGKIIEIGAVTLNTSNGKITKLFHELSNPGELPNEFIQNLIGRTAAEIAEARGSKEVLSDFWEAFAEDGGKKLAGWGNDTQQIIEQSLDYKLSFDWPKQYDLKQTINLYTHFVNRQNVKYKMGLKKTMEQWDLEFEGDHHCAYDDAYNTAQLAYKVFNDMGTKKTT